eukprot:TRINITY_DN17425_c0_g1_i1.p1 TRINITY_DN17425_c0_g1~~TRINITY_DN17425_c0_g1_i1.p1  ORF type:complete len:510 (-),score=100.07 TRINITY_DN17425_c0_g1_i1:96-1550(-)
MNKDNQMIETILKCDFTQHSKYPLKNMKHCLELMAAIGVTCGTFHEKATQLPGSALDKFRVLLECACIARANERQPLASYIGCCLSYMIFLRETQDVTVDHTNQMNDGNIRELLHSEIHLGFCKISKLPQDIPFKSLYITCDWAKRDEKCPLVVATCASLIFAELNFPTNSSFARGQTIQLTKKEEMEYRNLFLCHVQGPQIKNAMIFEEKFTMVVKQVSKTYFSEETIFNVMNQKARCFSIVKVHFLNDLKFAGDRLKPDYHQIIEEKLCDHLENFKKTNEWSEQAALEVCLHIAASLGYLHDIGVNHLDVKPENVMRTVFQSFGANYRYNLFKIIDFGNAVHVDPISKELDGQMDSDCLGDIKYCDPRLLKNNADLKKLRCSKKLDVYSFGKLMEFVENEKLTSLISACTSSNLRHRPCFGDVDVHSPGVVTQILTMMNHSPRLKYFCTSAFLAKSAFREKLKGNGLALDHRAEEEKTTTTM